MNHAIPKDNRQDSIESNQSTIHTEPFHRFNQLFTIGTNRIVTIYFPKTVANHIRYKRNRERNKESIYLSA